MAERTYLAIDLKSFYASVECADRGLDPMTTHLVVADPERTEKTICLAVTPPLKAYGIPGRARLFEVVEKVRAVNAGRLRRAPGGVFSGSSWDAAALSAHPELELEYLVAPPRMALYLQVSARVYEVYLRHVAPEDIHVYSIDEVFVDATPYLRAGGITPRAFARRIIRDVLESTGITATAGIGPNLFLCKVAMDIVAKRTRPDRDGMRIAELTEESYRRTLWDHRPLTDFWRVGRGYARKLEANGLYTMGDIARCSLGGPGEFHNEELLYRLFGVNAELLIDHAWGWEPCTMADIKAYRPASGSVGSGQVLQRPYPFAQARLVAREMADQLALDLVDRGLTTDRLTLTVGYDRENLADRERQGAYRGPVVTDPYGRLIPRHAHGTARLERHTASARVLMAAVTGLFDRIVDQRLLVRRLNVTAGRVAQESAASGEERWEQLDLFVDGEGLRLVRERERRIQETLLDIKRKFGRNAILRGMDLEDGATARERNEQIGGHRA